MYYIYLKVAEQAKRMKETEGLHAMGTSANTEEQDKVK